MKDIHDKVVEISVSEITPYEGSHNTDSVIGMLRESVRQFGIQQPIILDENKVIVAGNGVYKAAVQEGYEKLPCVILSNLTKDEIAEYRIADNKTSEFARWNEKKLKKELSYLQEPSSLQFCFDENIKAMLGMDNPIIPKFEKKEEQAKPKETVVLNEVQKQQQFKEQLKQIDKELEAKPREYIEYVCSNCHKKVVIKQ
jgi:hypothetical protein